MISAKGLGLRLYGCNHEKALSGLRTAGGAVLLVKQDRPSNLPGRRNEKAPRST